MCPTYHRIEKLTRFIKSAQKTCSDKANICFTFCVNISDTATEHLIKALCEGWDYLIVYEDMPHPNIAKFYNLMCKHTKKEPETIISMLGDDMEFITPGYDKFLINKINQHNGIGIFYCDHKGKKRNLCVLIFTTRKFIEYNRPEPFMNELFPCDVIDRLWKDTAERLGCYYYCHEVVVLHHHSKKDRDATYVRLRTVAHITRENEKGYSDILDSQFERMNKFVNPVIEKPIVEAEEMPAAIVEVKKSVKKSTPKFIPEVVTKPKVEKKPPGSVLFALMGRYGDIIMGSFIANMLIDRGHEVTWLTIPHYEELVKVVCEKANVICMDSGSDWAETNSHNMRMVNFGYKHYINAQLGGKENHNSFIASDIHPARYVKKLAEKEIGEALPDAFIPYATLKPLKRIVIDRKKPLAIIAPETSSVLPAMTKELIEESYNKYKDKYHVKILVEKKVSDNRYIYGYSFIECISLLQQTALFIGNDSGLAWASLYNPRCKKIIYHLKKRLEKTKMSFRALDKNAEDISLNINYAKEHEIEYKKERRNDNL